LVVKPAQLGSNLGVLLLVGGMFLASAKLIWLGIILFSAFVLFTLVTLPVELNASSRAVKVLEQYGIITTGEQAGARAVLNAAALTYVAGALSAIAQLAYFVFRSGILSRDED
jgi:Zn-dependent membrane protease YugP